MKKFSRALILAYEKNTKSENAREQVKATWGAGVNNSAQEFSSQWKHDKLQRRGEKRKVKRQTCITKGKETF